MNRIRPALAVFIIGVAGPRLASAADPPVGAAKDVAKLADEVRKTERAFAASMAARDHAAFTAFVADEAVFFGSKSVQRGKPAVAAAWKRFFETPKAPFSWEPEEVEVLDSGTLALSSGPVRDTDGSRIGTFTSVWRREGSAWKIVLDKGCPPCDCGKAESAKSGGKPADASQKSAKPK